MLVRPLLVGLTVLWLGSISSAQAQPGQLPNPLRTPEQEAGYAIGLQIGQGLKNDGLTANLIDLKAMLLGIQDAIQSKQPRIAETQVKASLQRIQQIAQQNASVRLKQEGTKNQAQGQQFMAKYKKFKGVKSLPSGVLYRVVKSGSGPSPAATDRVKTHYTGKLVDGKVFDSSEGGQPAVFPVEGVIRGWTEALQSMKVGDKWQLVIPPELAYGERGSPPVIPPQATLVFDIELLDIVK